MPTHRQLIRLRWNWQEIRLFSNDLRTRIFMSQPAPLVKVARVFRRLESACEACQSMPSVEKKTSVSAVPAYFSGWWVNFNRDSWTEGGRSRYEWDNSWAGKESWNDFDCTASQLRGLFRLPRIWPFCSELSIQSRGKQSSGPTEGWAVPVRSAVVAQAPIVANRVNDPVL